MATLQTIRSKGPLLVVVIGLALFAFIAGDAWKVLQPHQGKQDVGEVNGKTLTAQEYQKMVDEYTEVIKLTQGVSALNDDQLTQVKDQVWQSYVNNQLIAAEAAKLGLTVSKAEVQAIIEEGTNPLLMQTPFRNPQTGAFDKDMLKKFLVDYAHLDASKMPAQYVEYYQKMGAFWNFIEKTLIQSTLAEKYQNLIAKSLISNPVAAEDAFTSRTEQSDVLLAAIPYSSISDSTITVSNSEIKDLYNKKKSSFEQPVETRNIKYIDVLVTPSEEDRKEVLNEVTEYANQLGTAADMNTFIRSTGSVVPFSEIAINKTVYPNDVVARLDSVTINEVYGPYYNQADDSYNAFKIIAKQTAPDSIQYRQIQVYAEDAAKTATLADSIFNALKDGADFAELAKEYSSDAGSAKRGGELPAFGVGEMVEPFEVAAFALNTPGELSRPVKTRFGYHIIKLIEKKGLPSFEDKKKGWSRQMAQGERNFEYYGAFDERMKKEYGYRFYPEAYAELRALCNDYFPSDPAFYEKAKDMNKTLFHLNGTDFPQSEFAYYIQRCPFSTKSYAGDFMQEVYDLFIRDIVTTAERQNLTTKHPEFDLLMKEYRDGILLFDISNKEIWNKPMDQQAKAEAEWIEQLNQKYPVTINWKLVKKVSKMTKK